MTTFFLYDAPETVSRESAVFTGYRMQPNDDGSWTVTVEFQRGEGTTEADFDPIGSPTRETIRVSGPARVARLDAVRDDVIAALQGRNRIPTGTIL